MKLYKLYEEITQSQFRDKVFSNNEIISMDFDDKEIKQIQAFNFRYRNEFKFISFVLHDNCFLHKLEDEWYYAAIGRGDYREAYYKCDQFDGLLQLLNNLLLRYQINNKKFNPIDISIPAVTPKIYIMS